MDITLNIIKVFLFAVSIDLLWVLYIFSISKNKKYQAAGISVLMGFTTIFGYLEIVENHLMSIPYLMGLGIGTIIGITINKKISKKQ